MDLAEGGRAGCRCGLQACVHCVSLRCAVARECAVGMVSLDMGQRLEAQDGMLPSL